MTLAAVAASTVLVGFVYAVAYGRGWINGKREAERNFAATFGKGRPYG